MKKISDIYSDTKSLVASAQIEPEETPKINEQELQDDENQALKLAISLMKEDLENAANIQTIADLRLGNFTIKSANSSAAVSKYIALANEK